MNLKYLSIAAAASLVVAASAFAHGDEKPGATAATQPATQADGHSHEHGDSDAIGEAGVAGNVSRTVDVAMTDTMRFSPSSIDVKQGETVRFVVKNAGQLKHEMVLGTKAELKEHYELMMKFPEMEHAEPQMVTVAPGKTGEVVWRFTKAGKVDFGCLQPGHYDAGMKGLVTVAANEAATEATSDTATAGGANAEQPAATDMAAGEVRKVDKDTKKITLKHGPLKNLDMPAMTMVFHVKDPSMLDAVKVGDKVSFQAEKAGSALTLTELRNAP